MCLQSTRSQRLTNQSSKSHQEQTKLKRASIGRDQHC